MGRLFARNGRPPTTWCCRLDCMHRAMHAQSTGKHFYFKARSVFILKPVSVNFSIISLNDA